MIRTNPIALGFITKHPVDCARILEELPVKASSSLIASIRPELAANIAERMVTSYASNCLNSIDTQKAVSIIKEMNIQQAARLLRAMPAADAEALTELLPAHLTNNIRSAFRYPDLTVGRIMDTNPLTIPESITVNNALKRIKDIRNRAVSVIFVVDDAHTPKGIIHVADLLSAPKAFPVLSIVSGIPCLTPKTSLESAAMHTGWQEFSALPVAGTDNILLGVLKSSTLLRILSEERGKTKPPDLMDEAFSMSRMYWIAMTELLNTIARSMPERSDNDGNRPG